MTGWRRRFKAVIPYGSSTNNKAPVLLPDEPEVIVRGQGCRVWDDAGREYIDYRNALGPVTLGYRFPATDQAIVAQLASGISFGHPHPLECEVAELFCSLVPSAEQARFLKTGGEAVAATIRLARAWTGRDHVVQIGYNGWLNSLASGAMVRPGVASDRPAGVPAALAALHHQVGWDDRATLEDLSSRLDGRIAAIVVSADYAGMERGGAFYPYLRELADRSGALLIFDQIVTGFRLAVGGVEEYFGVRPDLSVFAKGIANGMPLSVYSGRRDVMSLIDSGKVVITSTLGGETLSLACARATMQTYRDQDVVDHLWRAGRRLWGGVAELFDEHSLPLSIQGLAPCPALVPLGGGGGAAREQFLRAAYRHGVSLNDVSYVNFSHQQSDIDETLERLDAACSQVRAG